MITIVTGLPRSGTSMMMHMLQAGGMPILSDGLRCSDPDNPQGYFEFEPVKQIANDASWLRHAEGRAIKIIAPLLSHLPDGHQYVLLWMQRRVEEVVASQTRMLLRRGIHRPDDPALEQQRWCKAMTDEMGKIQRWLVDRPAITSLSIDYNQMMIDPAPAVQRIAAFLARPMDLDAMTAIADPKLYRCRSHPTERPPDGT